MSSNRQKIAVIGSGISGLACAYFLQKRYAVTLYEANDYLGGHTNTVDIKLEGKTQAVDTGFLVFNDNTYPNLIALFEELNVQTYATDMSFGVSLNNGDLEWAGTNLDSVFAQRKNLFSLGFLRMMKDILRFNRSAYDNLNAALKSKISLGELLNREAYSSEFKHHYLLPMAAAIWSSAPNDILNFPASTFLRFCLNHSLLQVNNRPKWRTVLGGARTYVQKIAATLSDVRLNTPVLKVARDNETVHITTETGIEEFDAVIFATHAPDTLRLLTDASTQEATLLSKVRYQANAAILHTDTQLLPKNKKVWSAWNYLSGVAVTNNSANPVCVSYLLNQLQDLNFATPVIVTLNPIIPINPEKVIETFDYDHPVFDSAAIDAQEDLYRIQGQNKTWFAGAWTGYGFHEDGLKSALKIVQKFDAAPLWAKV
jgi:predicted NAD/FAD-binding protein